ncbi:MAG: M3 family metallopeptidase, partial [Pseudomonadota bacterium]|nr:M3 family metallopeptidase [Pseudomonadota bacterium]
MTNILLQQWDTPFGLPPFDQIKDEDFAPAFDAAMEQDLAEIEAVANNPDAPTFENTIEGLMCTGRTLDKVAGVFYNIAGSDSNETREAIMRDYAPKFAAHGSKIYSNKALFQRIAAVYDARDSLDLNDEQQRVLMLMHRNFIRAGAALEGDEDERLKVIKSRLAELGTQFTQNLLADERGWSMELAEDDLEGLPDFVISAMRSAGEERGKGPCVTLSRSVIVPFLQFSPRRDLREKAYRAWGLRGANGGDTDNRGIAAETLKLREERAKLLGYDDFTAYTLATEMEGNADNVRGLLMDVWGPAKAAADADAKVLEGMLHADGIQGPLEAWDWHYYAQKRRMAEHDLDEAQVKPYFQLENMIQAAFDCSTKLFGLEFAPLDVPLYHDDARA